MLPPTQDLARFRQTHSNSSLTHIHATCPDNPCGPAITILAGERHGQVLRDKGILYAPDCVINAGGIINVSAEAADKLAERRLEAGKVH